MGLKMGLFPLERVPSRAEKLSVIELILRRCLLEFLIPKSRRFSTQLYSRKQTLIFLKFEQKSNFFALFLRKVRSVL
jgi:hypothetical protein